MCQKSEPQAIYFDEGILLAGPWQKGRIQMEKNLYWYSGDGSLDFCGMSFEDWQVSGRDAGSLVALVKKHRKPIIGFTFQSHQNSFIQKLVEHGLPVFPSPERAARAMTALVSYSHNLETIRK